MVSPSNITQSRHMAMHPSARTEAVLIVQYETADMATADLS
jgi:hypothetical protein